MKTLRRKRDFAIVLATIVFSQLTSPLRAVDNTADKPSSKPEPLILKSEASDDSQAVVNNPPPVPRDASPAVRIVADPATPQLSFLGVDTERGDRVTHNLLRAPIHLLLKRADGASTPIDKLPCVVEHDERSVRYRIKVADDVTLIWKIVTGQGQWRMYFHKIGAGKNSFTGFDLVFPLDPKTCATSIISGEWFKNEEFALPAILSAPDLGQFHVSSHDNITVNGNFVGERGSHSRRPNSLDLTLHIGLTTDRGGWLDFAPLILPRPKGVDRQLWRQARRGWFNLFQLSSHWQRAGGARGAPAGIIANNVLSDPVSSLLWFHGDQALLLPELAPGVRATDVLRHTIEFWLNDAVEPDGQVWYVAAQKYQMMDANPAVLIAAWCYVEATGDHKWAKKNLSRLELIADYLARRDIDHDGLCESVQSGNAGANAFPGDTSIDTIYSGHKNAWVNALVFRAWRCLAEIETKLHRPDVAERYRGLSDKLRIAYAPKFLDPSTSKLAWWVSSDGKAHDYASVLVASYAVEYGLLEQAQSRAVIETMWKQIDVANYRRFDIGLPLNLVAVPPTEQCNPGGPDAFGHYCNGGVFPQFAVNTMTASWSVGQNDRADKMLHAMLERQDHGVFPNGGGFQCGITDKMGTGPEIYDWNGATTGYEGHCVRDCSFVMGLLLRDPAIRAKVYRPVQ